MSTQYVLNVNDGIDTLHRYHGDERCNRDDMEDHEEVDEATFESMKAGGYVRLCKHCIKEPDHGDH